MTVSTGLADVPWSHLLAGITRHPRRKGLEAPGSTQKREEKSSFLLLAPNSYLLQ